MAREDLHFRLRIPETLKTKIEAAAEENRRSMTAEIVHRLEASFAWDTENSDVPAGFVDLPAGITEDQFAAALTEANRQALGVALKRLGIVVRPAATEGSEDD